MALGVITKTGRQLLCRAHAGDCALPVITHMAFGDGGVDENGEGIQTTGEETALRNEGLRKEITGRVYEEEETTCKYTARLSKNDLVNVGISEIGLYDSAGNLVAYKTCKPKGKDDDMEFVFDMKEIF